MYGRLLFSFSIPLYAFTHKNGFVRDSESVILNDPSIRDYRYIPYYFTEDFLKHAVEIL
jgi:hypothetical protein